MMQIEVIERYVDQVLEVNGFCKGDKELLRQLLHRLYTAATMFHLMTEEQRALVERIMAQLSAHFVTKIKLKERKRKERQRKNPPHPLIKEKETKEKDEKTRTYAARREAFHQECLKYVKCTAEPTLSKPQKFPFSFAYSEIFANFAHNHQQYVWAQMQPLACAFYLD